MTTRPRRTGVLSTVLAVGGGLAVTGATVGSWVSIEVEREVAGIARVEEIAVSGATLAPLALVLGPLAVVLGIALVPAYGKVRRALGSVVLLVAVGCGASIGYGIVAGIREHETLTGAPVGSALGAVAIAVAAFLALQTPRPSAALPERFDLDALDDEWHRASDPREDES